MRDDEYGGKSILKFVDLKLKIYSILDESNNEKSTNKGHNTFIEFQEFHDTLFQYTISEKDSQTSNERNKV